MSSCLSPLGRDGIPPYRIRKQHRREMQENVQVNGRVPLPHIPVSSSAWPSPSLSPSLGLTSPLGPMHICFLHSDWAAVALASGKGTCLASCELGSDLGVAHGHMWSCPAGWRRQRGWLIEPSLHGHFRRAGSTFTQCTPYDLFPLCQARCFSLRWESSSKSSSQAWPLHSSLTAALSESLATSWCPPSKLL